MLERGELQVSELERQREYAQLARDVVQVLVDKCVNPDTGVPYTAGVLERALRACHVALDPKRSAKQQALDALPKLAASFPIARARMRFRVAAPAAAEAALRAQLAEHGALVEAEDTQGGLLTGARLRLRMLPPQPPRLTQRCAAHGARSDVHGGAEQLPRAGCVCARASVRRRRAAGGCVARRVGRHSSRGRRGRAGRRGGATATRGGAGGSAGGSDAWVRAPAEHACPASRCC